jgi:hypothetical protein
VAENLKIRTNEAVNPLKMNGFFFWEVVQSRQAIENAMLIALKPSTH